MLNAINLGFIQNLLPSNIKAGITNNASAPAELANNNQSPRTYIVDPVLWFSIPDAPSNAILAYPSVSALAA